MRTLREVDDRVSRNGTCQRGFPKMLLQIVRNMTAGVGVDVAGVRFAGGERTDEFSSSCLPCFRSGSRVINVEDGSARQKRLARVRLDVRVDI